MVHHATATLLPVLRRHLDLSKSRLATLCLVVFGMIGARSVNLSHIACERGGRVLIGSTYRRLQRLFEQVELEGDWCAPLVRRLLAHGGSWYLALDRTQWRIGRREVNFLVLAAVTPRVRVPLIWTLIEGRGCSSTAQRIALMRRYLAAFPASSVRYLLADREFVGREWLAFLNENNIPFAIRLKGDLRVTTPDGHELTFDARLLRRRRTVHLSGWLGAGCDRSDVLLHFAAKRLASGEWLIVATNRKPGPALNAYAKRWSIECLFGDAKTRGLNLEDTRLTDPRKLDLLMACVTLALVLATRTAMLRHPQPPRRGPDGHLAKSWFRIGFDELRRLLRSDPASAADFWPKIAPPPLQQERVV